MRSRWMILSVLVVLSLVLFPNGTALAQEPTPPEEPEVTAPGGSLGTYGQRIEAARADEKAELEGMTGGQPLGEGGDGVFAEGTGDVVSASAVSDGYGYAVKVVPVSWIDVAGNPGATKLDFSAKESQLVTLPFPFTFYEDTYSTVNVVLYGYLTFSNYQKVQSQGMLKQVIEPNSIIAPYLAPIYLGDETRGDVYMVSGGDAPNRWVAFEWNHVSDQYTSGQNDFTFEVVLYENGQILFQYNTMTYTSRFSYATAGLEDSTGMMAQVTLKYKTKQRSNRAVLFTRPTGMVSLKMFPLEYGAFARPSTPAEFKLRVKNTGTLDSDTFDVRIVSRWAAQAFKADGTTPLDDTDGDGKMDTGAVAVGKAVDVVIKVTPPATAKVGNSTTSLVSFTSSLRTNRKKIVRLTTTVPAVFAQAYLKDTLRTRSDVMAVNTDPTGIVGYPVSPAANGYNPLVTEQPNGNLLYTWSEYPCADFRCEQVMYSIRTRAGDAVAGPRALRTPPAGTWEFHVAAATAPNGVTGMTFVQEVEVAANSFIYNLFFAAIDASGNVVVSPTNLTNSTIPDDQPGGLFFYQPQINATAGNRFFISWDRKGEAPDHTTASDIIYTVLESNGAVVMPPTNLTNDVGRGMGFYCTSLAQLTGDRMLLAYNGWLTKGRNWSEYTFSVVLNNDGTVARSAYGISLGKVDSERVDAVQMSNGQVLLAWVVTRLGKTYVQYAVLKDGTFTKAKGPVGLAHNAALTGGDRVSVTRDAEGRGIITWMDQDVSYAKNLYYTVVGLNGRIITKPTIFMSAEPAGYLMVTGLGNGNSPYTVTAP